MSPVKRLDPRDLALHGGHPALDFVNTIDPRTGPEPHLDYITDFEALCRWALHGSLIDEGQANAVLRAGRDHPRQAARVWKQAIELREALHGVLIDLVAGLEPRADEVEVIAGEHRRAQAHVDLVPRDENPDKGSPALRFELSGRVEAESILWQLARWVTDLLTEVDATRLRVCPGDEAGCGWVVLDSTRNRSRRWCDMGACGSSVKSARLTARRRAARSGAGAPT